MPWPRLEPGPFDPESNALTIRPPGLSMLGKNWTKQAFFVVYLQFKKSLSSTARDLFDQHKELSNDQKNSGKWYLAIYPIITRVKHTKTWKRPLFSLVTDLISEKICWLRMKCREIAELNPTWKNSFICYSKTEIWRKCFKMNSTREQCAWKLGKYRWQNESRI